MLARVYFWQIMTAVFLAACVFPATFAIPQQARPDGSADLVLLDAKVITVDASDRIAQAVAVKADRIVAVGSNPEVSRWIGAATRVERLGGKAVLPGLIDAHTHIEGIAEFHRMLDIHVPPLKGTADILEKVRERVRLAQPDEW